MAQYELIDLTGKKFNRLTVLRLHSKGKRTRWICKCDCGKETIKEAYSLKNGLAASCGCIRREKTIERHITHGLCKHPLFSVWGKMKDRCNNANNPAFINYGGRGIKVCAEWNDSFQIFYNWCINNGWAKGLQLDRKRNNKGYYPSNCRFVTVMVNANNKRNNVRIKYKNTFYGMLELEKISGISGDRILRRIRDYGWTLEKAMSTPVRNSSLKSERAFAQYQ